MSIRATIKRGTEEVYMLDGDGGTIGYPYSVWCTGSILATSTQKVGYQSLVAIGNPPQSRCQIMPGITTIGEDSSQDSDTSEHVEAFDDETYDHERASEAASGAVYVNVEGEVQVLIL